MSTCIMDTRVMDSCIMDTMDTHIMTHASEKNWLWSPLRGSHGLSAVGTKDEVEQARRAAN